MPKICYEIFVRSFCDSNHDGIGDINGVTSKLDYLQNLGVEAIWLSPICKSNSYHKYDVINYQEIDPEFGNFNDFERLIEEAHGRNIKVFFDFIINHTSEYHPWFIEAKKNKNSPYRNYYIWQTPQKIKEQGIEFRKKTADTWETNPWHKGNNTDLEKYYGIFWSGMPDLNMDNLAVREEIYSIAEFWIKKGVDGFRMDAAQHIYPTWQSEKNHAFWQAFKERLESIKPDIYIVGEVWTDAEKVAPFFRGLKANFDFDLCYAIQNIIKTGVDDKNVIEMLLKNYKLFSEENPNFIDATLLSNHDQDRIASVANGDTLKLKMAANLLLTLPGQPYIYYGEELGMRGTKPDENIREAFLWNSRNIDKDRTNWRKPKFNTDSKVTPFALQSLDENSLYRHYKTMITLRKTHEALGQVALPNLKKSQSLSPKLLSFIRPHQTGDLLILQNISNQIVEIEIVEKVNSVIQYQSAKLTNQKAEFQPFGMLIIQVL